MNKDLYGKTFSLPEDVVNYLQQCYDSAHGANDTTEGYRRNIELRNSRQVTYQQLKRMKNWFDSFGGDRNDLSYILNGGDYVKNWVNNTIGNLRKGDQQNTEIHRDYMPDDVNQDLIDDMGWLADMNRPSKEHSSVNDDIRITEALKRINDIMKKII